MARANKKAVERSDPRLFSVPYVVSRGAVDRRVTHGLSALLIA